MSQKNLLKLINLKNKKIMQQVIDEGVHDPNAVLVRENRFIKVDQKRFDGFVESKKGSTRAILNEKNEVAKAYRTIIKSVKYEGRVLQVDGADMLVMELQIKTQDEATICFTDSSLGRTTVFGLAQMNAEQLAKPIVFELQKKMNRDAKLVYDSVLLYDFDGNAINWSETRKHLPKIEAGDDESKCAFQQSVRHLAAFVNARLTSTFYEPFPVNDQFLNIQSFQFDENNIDKLIYQIKVNLPIIARYKIDHPHSKELFLNKVRSFLVAFATDLKERCDRATGKTKTDLEQQKQDFKILFAKFLANKDEILFDANKETIFYHDFCANFDNKCLDGEKVVDIKNKPLAF